MKSSGINTIYDLADDLPAMIRSSPQILAYLRPLGGLIGNVVLNHNVSISKNITVINESLRQSLKFRTKSVMIPNGVDSSLFKIMILTNSGRNLI